MINGSTQNGEMDSLKMTNGSRQNDKWEIWRFPQFGVDFNFGVS